MTYHRLAYEDADGTTQMASDALLAGQVLQTPAQPERGAESVAGPHFSDYPPRQRRTVEVTPGLAAMAAGMELHFD